MALINESEVLDLIRSGHRWIDVRAPIEYVMGTIPNAVNLPILDNEERRLVGTCYKVEGRESAMALGHQLVSGANRELKIQNWLNEIKLNQNEISLFCFRGGLRSQISQQWLKEQGVAIRRVAGGYKHMRYLLIQYLQEQIQRASIRLISGPTGSWKTHMIQWLDEKGQFAIDLEEHAVHRGSAFGKRGLQPQQINFEHSLTKNF